MRVLLGLMFGVLFGVCGVFLLWGRTGPARTKSTAPPEPTAASVAPARPAPRDDDDLLAVVDRQAGDEPAAAGDPAPPPPARRDDGNRRGRAAPGITAAPGEPPAAAESRPPAAPETTRQEVKTALEGIRIFIDNASLASGRMPTPEFTYEAVKQAAPEYARLIYLKKIVIHPAGSREEVWGHENKSAGTVYVLFADGVQELDAAALRRRLGR